MARIAAVIGIALVLAGCDKNIKPTIGEPNEYEIALSAIPQEMYGDCPALGPMPANQVGLLLQDHSDVTARGACFKSRYEELRPLIVPLIEKAKAARGATK